MAQWEDYLKTIYYDPRHPASFAGPQKLYKVVQHEGKYKIGMHRIRQFLYNQDAYSLHKPVRRRFQRNHVISACMDDLWMADLIDMVKYAEWNQGYKYILLVIDTFSKYVWLRPLKRKTGDNVAEAFADIFKSTKRSPAKLMTDKEGGEFVPKNTDEAEMAYRYFESIMIKDSNLDPSSENKFRCGNYYFSFTLSDRAKPFQVTLTVSLVNQTFINHCQSNMTGQNVTVNITTVAPATTKAQNTTNTTVAPATTKAPNTTNTTERCQTITIHWGDISQSELQIKKNRETINHEYTHSGVYQVKVTYTEENSTSTKTCPETKNNSCLTTPIFFSEEFKNPRSPMKFLVTEDILIKAMVSIEMSCQSNATLMTWSVNQISKSGFITVYNTQTESPYLHLSSGTLMDGLYIVSLEIMVSEIASTVTVHDYILLLILMPNLVTYITDQSKMNIEPDTTVVFDASMSYDPIEHVPYVASQPLFVKWSFMTLPYETVKQEKELLYSFPPTVPMLPDQIVYEVQNGSDFMLQLDTGLFNASTDAVVMFTLERGLRQSSSLLGIRIRKSIFARIDCVYNCVISRERRLNIDRLELNAVIPEGVPQSVKYRWKTLKYSEELEDYENIDHNTPSGRTSRAYVIPEEVFESESSYLFELKLVSPGKVTYVKFAGHVSVLPYDGICTLNGKRNDEIIEVIAANELVEFECLDWKGPNSRLKADPVLDVSPFLTYTVWQITKGVVKKEPIEKFRTNKGKIILKLGDPKNDYKMTVMIRITDMYNAFVEYKFTVKSLPTFSWDAVTPTEEGAAIVKNYTMHYLLETENLRRVQGYHARISYISSVASHLHLIDLPVFELPLPPVLGSGGSLLDLQTNGEEPSSDTLGDLRRKLEYTPDPATLAIQELLGYMTQSFNEIEEEVVKNNFTTDKVLVSLITNANNNLIVLDLGPNAKVTVLGSTESFAVSVMEPQNPHADESKRLVESSKEVVSATENCVHSAVPKRLKQYRHIDNFLLGKQQVSEMLLIIGQNVSLDQSVISPNERALSYLQMQQNILLEVEANKAIAARASDMARTVLKAVRDGIPICNSCSNKDSSSLVIKNNAHSIQHTWISTDNATFNLNGSLETFLRDGGDENLVAAIVATEFKENVFMYDDDLTSSFVSSNVLHIDVKAGENEIMPNATTFTQTVTSPEPTLTKPLIDPEDVSELSLHIFFYQSKTDYVCLKIKPSVKKQNSELTMKPVLILQYKIYISFKKAPTLLDYDFIETVSWDTDWMLYVEPAKMTGHTGLVYLGVFVPGEVKLIEYEFSLVTVSCVTWEEEIRKWHTDKCLPEWLPQENKVICTCENLTELTFGNTFNPAPNTIDFSTVFLKFSPRDQAAILGVMGGLFLTYFIMMLLMSMFDSKDQLKWGMTSLLDNRIGDKKFYILKISTGLRRGAGTKSKIGFEITGNKGSSGTRSLYDGIRQEFSSGSDMVFLMSTSEDLGFIEHIYLWNDNSGGSTFGDWYLNQVVVYDLDRKLTYTFIAEQWLSIDSSLEASLFSNLTEETLPLGHQFCHQTRLGLSERNMWTSIIYRPESSVFTRVQRLTCVFLYIVLTMFTSAMFYRDDPEYESQAVFKVGPFRFSVDQLYRSVMSASISTPPVMLLSFLFKRKRPEQFNISNKRKRSRCFCGFLCCHSEYNEELRMRIVWSGQPEVQGGLYLPYWCLGFVWFLAIFGILVPSFFVVLYCIQWGKQKSEEWLMSVGMSIVESVLFVDPILMVATAFLVACLFRKSENILMYDMDAILTNYNKMFNNRDVEAYTGMTFHVLRDLVGSLKQFTVLSPKPLVRGVEYERQARDFKHKREIKMVLSSVMVNLVLVFIMLSICYSARDDASFHHHQDITRQIVKPALKRTSPKFNFASIKKQDDMYTWLSVSVFPWLFPETDLTGSPLHWIDRQYTRGYTYLRLGPPRLRQLRVKQDMCSLPYMETETCYGQYSLLNDEEGAYCIGWTNKPCSLESKVKNVSLSAWSFTSGLDIWGLPLRGLYTLYGGGGYLATFDINFNISDTILKELEHGKWLDRQSRAVVLEFTLFCANTNLFIFNEFLVEFPETGGALTSQKIYPLRLYNNAGIAGLYVLVCGVILLLYWIFLTIRVFLYLFEYGKACFKDIWKICDLVIVLLVGLTIVFFIVRLLLVNETIARFNVDKSLFVNFAHIVFWDNLLATALGFVTFLANIRILQAFNNAKKIQAIMKIFGNCGIDLLWFGLTFWYTFIGFVLFGVLLFGSRIEQFMSVFVGMKTLFLSLIGKSMFKVISEVQPFFAQVFFIFFTICIIFFVMVIFLSILGDGISSVLHSQKKDRKEDIIEYMLKTLKNFFSRKKKYKTR